MLWLSHPDIKLCSFNVLTITSHHKMYPYEHLMQKHLLYKYPTLGILLVLPPWVMSYQQPMGFIYHGSTNPISLPVNYNPDLWENSAPILVQAVQADLRQMQPREISTWSWACSSCCSNTKRQQRSPNPHGNICISDPCTSMPDTLSSKRRWALWKRWQYASTKFSSGNPTRNAARVGFHDPELPSQVPATQENARLHFCHGVKTLLSTSLKSITR